VFFDELAKWFQGIVGFFLNRKSGSWWGGNWRRESGRCKSVFFDDLAKCCKFVMKGIVGFSFEAISNDVDSFDLICRVFLQ
jgi:hypothetical protein